MAVFWDNPPSEMGKRFKDEIERTELDAKTIVSYGYISRAQLTTMLHGSFDNIDGAALKRLALNGIDIQYVLTGIHTVLRPEETALLNNYRESTSDNQRIIRDVSAAIKKSNLIEDEDCA